MINNEFQLTQYLKDNWSEIFPEFILVGFNMPILGWVTKKRIGFADIIFKYKLSYYVVEIKYEPETGHSNFWTSLKVLGYTTALNIYYNTKKYKPMILLEQSNLTKDFWPIVGKHKISYILLNKISTGLYFSYYI